MSQFRPTRIILHCSATEDSGTVSWQAIRRYHMKECAWSDIGYHYGLELVNDHYEALVGRMLDTPGAHCQDHNHDSIGVCFVGNFDNKAPSLDQWQLGCRLVRSLCYVYCIGHDRVFGHREFTNKKTCPGKMFDLDLFRAQLNPY
jgi:N-acetylmuramoyl-L-alanine amidase